MPRNLRNAAQHGLVWTETSESVLPHIAQVLCPLYASCPSFPGGSLYVLEALHPLLFSNYHGLCQVLEEHHGGLPVSINVQQVQEVQIYRRAARAQGGGVKRLMTPWLPADAEELASLAKVVKDAVLYAPEHSNSRDTDTPFAPEEIIIVLLSTWVRSGAVTDHFSSILFFPHALSQAIDMSVIKNMATSLADLYCDERTISATFIGLFPTHLNPNTSAVSSMLHQAGELLSERLFSHASFHTRYTVGFLYPATATLAPDDATAIGRAPESEYPNVWHRPAKAQHNCVPDKVTTISKHGWCTTRS
jgi:hypothetical protein